MRNNLDFNPNCPRPPMSFLVESMMICQQQTQNSFRRTSTLLQDYHRGYQTTNGPTGQFDGTVTKR